MRWKIRDWFASQSLLEFRCFPDPCNRVMTESGNIESQSLLELRCFPDDGRFTNGFMWLELSQSLLELRCFPDEISTKASTAANSSLNLC